MDGKIDWMAAGLPVEGEDGPFVGERLVEVPTFAHDDTVADARAGLAGSGAGEAVVVGCDRLAIGLVDDETLDGAADDDRLIDVMVVVPSAIRPSVTLDSLAGDEPRRVVVTTAEGRLLGVADAGLPDHDGHDHDGHDHDGHDHDGHDHDGLAGMEDELDAVMAEVREKFGDRDPTEAEVRTLLRDRLVAEGRSPDEADQFLADLGGD